MKVVTGAQMRDLDRRTIAEFGVPGEVLMERAGIGVAAAVRDLASLSGRRGPIRLFAGHGNNGGDAFVAARHLKERGFKVDVALVGPLASVKGDALTHLERLKGAGVGLRDLADETGAASPRREAAEAGIVVDGVLGTGLEGPAREPAASAIRQINALGSDHLVVAIDLPSGLNADTGEAPGDTVCADLTVTLGLPKRGLLQPRALDFTGNLEVVDIGIPAALVAGLDSDLEFVEPTDLRPLLGRRHRDLHKGSFGHALLLGGAPGYSGAAALAAGGALRSGVGLVTALVPGRVAPTVAAAVPEAMVHAGAENSAATLAADCLYRWQRKLSDFDAVLIGPGLTQHEDTRALVVRLLIEYRGTLILDADALFGPELLDSLRRAVCPTIITPHPGEMARLLGRRVSEIQADRFGAARAVAEATGAVVVLKGAGTVIAARSRPLQVNMTGNPGMATGGMGDVLGGLMAGLAAQRLDPFDAARLAVFLHGRAGDLGSRRTAQACLTAGTLIRELHGAFRELWPR
jgi:ADP-dependent NAD(P)H-hydrate dehydratase / NAD(P)H-hydrate epimerase